jgi:hypothetical protein
MTLLASNNAWQRARAIKLHEHFKGVAVRLEAQGARLGAELGRVALLLDGRELHFSGGSLKLKASAKTVTREWYRWQEGGCQANALLLGYKAGCGGHLAVPAKLVAEIHRRATNPTGGRGVPVDV